MLQSVKNQIGTFEFHTTIDIKHIVIPKNIYNRSYMWKTLNSYLKCHYCHLVFYARMDAQDTNWNHS
jgi:hypothetical protein